ncbi:LAQU0S08e04478g1_1 [Lachancea quebecensis]|uniref:LAQU0S08e04478g1_1 n=1 Tax=Lachancea quebecensis TaxID=1654605 RepID=A0A0P1KT06_9SACH|nr:LAQU0S08e04478g1_1 [Lachancea quebecensis]
MSAEEPNSMEPTREDDFLPPALEGAAVEETNVLPADEVAVDDEEQEDDQESLYSHDEERDVAEKEDSATPEIQTATVQAENEGEVGAEGQLEAEDAQGGSEQVIDAVEIGDVQERKEEEEAQGSESALIEPDVVTVGQSVDTGADEADTAQTSDFKELAEDDVESSRQEAHEEEQTALVDSDNDDEKDQSVSSESGAHEQETSQGVGSDAYEKQQDEEEPEHDATESSEQELGSSSTQSAEPQPFDVARYNTDSENVDYGLLQRQATYILSSNMLNAPEFQQLAELDKINAVLTFLNSNPETAFQASTGQVAQLLNPQRTSQQEPRPDLSQPMTAVERKRYNEYLRGENRITEIQNIPPKSRLFIGNLPLKNVAKDDLFRIFSPYGHIYQINIKNAFGFIQYDNPQSVKAAIAGESNELNFGKKLILEISSSNSRPQYDHGDHGTNSSSTFISSTKRPFEEEEEEDMYSDSSYKRGKRRVPDCQIYVKRTADRSYANEVFNRFKQASGLETDMIFLKPRMELRKMINDAAYDGVWGVVLVNKTRNVDIQTFYKGPQGETKFDEYASVSCEDAIAIFNNLKSSRGDRMPAPVQHAPQQHAPQQHAPQQHAPQQHAPQQQYYGGYGAASAPHPPHQGQPYIQQPPYGGLPQGPAPGYGGPPPMAQGYGAYPGAQAHVSPPPPVVAPPMAAGPQMDQQQLFSAIQNLPPNVVSSLLTMAQQQPQQQQQLLGIIQSMQPQAQPHGGSHAGPSVPPAYQGYHQMQPQPVNTPPVQQHQQHQQQQQPPAFAAKSPPAQNPIPQQSQAPASGNNNVQSLLDSLAQLQQK